MHARYWGSSGRQFCLIYRLSLPGISVHRASLIRLVGAQLP